MPNERVTEWSSRAPQAIHKQASRDALREGHNQNMLESFLHVIAYERTFPGYSKKILLTVQAEQEHQSAIRSDLPTTTWTHVRPTGTHHRTNGARRVERRVPFATLLPPLSLCVPAQKESKQEGDGAKTNTNKHNLSFQLGDRGTNGQPILQRCQTPAYTAHRGPHHMHINNKHVKTKNKMSMITKSTIIHTDRACKLDFQ